MDESDVIARIKDLCEARNWTIYRLAKQSGITYSTLCTMLHKSTAPSIPTLVKLCRGLDISLSEFFDTGNQWATLCSAQKEHLRLWDALNEPNRQATEKYMQYLLSEQPEFLTK